MTIFEFLCYFINSAYIHDLSPFAIKFTETVGIRWYGLSYLAGFFCAYFIIHFLSKRGAISLKPNQVSDFIFYASVGAIVGGRLGYCFFYDTSLLTKFSNSFPFWGVLEVHKGGMASHGGILGVVIACFLYASRESLSRIELLDLVALGACLGIMFGRMANFVNGELVGRPVSESYTFAVKFPEDLLLIAESTPDKASDLAPLANTLGYSKEQIQSAIDSKDLYFFSDVAKTAYEEIYKGNIAVQDEASKILVPRHPSQIYAAFLEGLLLFAIILLARIYFPAIGVSSSLFVLLYPMFRVISESFRMPDPQIGFQLLGLTRGQWISLVMLLFGVFYSYIVLKKVK